MTPKDKAREMMETGDEKKLIADLKRQIKNNKGNMDDASWGYETGVLITGNEAKYILYILENMIRRII